MLPAGARLRRRGEFTDVLREGSRGAAPSLVVHLAAGPAADEAPRVGLVVGRSVGPATTRNTVKRRLRHLLRGRLAGMSPGTRVVVRARPAAAGRGYSVLGDDLDRALSRAQERAGRRGRR